MFARPGTGVRPVVTDPASFANPAVLEFYKTLPFNIRESVEASARAIQDTDPVSAYPVLRPLLAPGVRVLDVGCGTGWFANSLAFHHHAHATGIDFNPVAVERARAVAASMRLSTSFETADLFRYEPQEPFDVAVSLGVLHHTDNCAAAVQRLCERFVRPGGHAFIGLYHTHGRKPLLDHFQAMKERGASEAQMLARYRELHSHLADETLLLSWFRDQVLHPHETQHTLEEMMPVLESAGMELVSTSINRFEPFGSPQELFEQEKAYYDVGARRLEANEYFTGFFVFLARKRGGAIDSKPYVQHHPVFGYHYIPGTDLELPRPGGGRYRIRVNSEGIRSDREYAPAKPPGVRRIIVCGDSMAAGQFLANADRFSELLERRVPDLEVMNLALEGSGTDQQLLVYENVGLKHEHDLVILLPFLQNARRNLIDAREGIDAKTGRRVLRPKPRFELVGDRLELRNVPVPKEAAAGADAKFTTDVRDSAVDRMKATLNSLPAANAVKRALYGLVRWEPFPEYRDPESPEWRLMRAIVRRFKEAAGDRPLVIAPTFYSSYVRFRMARNYWARFKELESIPGLHAVDLLPYFRSAGPDPTRCFQEPYDMHFSAYGNLVLADALQKELTRRQLL